MKRTTLAVSILALCGCTVGPNYKRPQLALPPEFRGAPAGADHLRSIADTKWQDLFPDPALNQIKTSFGIDFKITLGTLLARNTGVPPGVLDGLNLFKAP